MSLVNDMLNDLDERRSKQPADGNSLQWLTGRVTTRSQKRFLPLIAFLFILLLTFLGFTLWKSQVAASRGSADQLLNRSEVVVSEKVSLGSPVELSSPAESRSSMAAGLPRQPTKPSSDTLEKFEKESRSNSVLQRERGAGIQTGEISEPDGASAGGDVSAEKIVDELVEAKVMDQKVADLARLPVKTARPLTPEQLDRQAAKKANVFLKNRELLAAEEVLLEFLESHPDAPTSGQLLVSIWMSQKKFDLAETLIDRLRSSRPRHVGLMIFSARLLLSTERSNSAVELLLSEQPPVAMYSNYYELLALATRQNKQYQLSERAYRSLLATNGNRGDWWFGLALALDAQGSQNNARSAFVRALRTNDLGSTLADYARKRLSAGLDNEG